MRGPRADVPRRALAPLDISLSHNDGRIWPLTVAYETVFGDALVLVLVGVGLSFMVLPKACR